MAALVLTLASSAVDPPTPVHADRCGTPTCVAVPAVPAVAADTPPPAPSAPSNASGATPGATTTTTTTPSSATTGTPTAGGDPTRADPSAGGVASPTGVPSGVPSGSGAAPATASVVVPGGGPADGLPVGGDTAGAVGVVSRTYAPSAVTPANPERGMYHYTETHWSADGSAYTPLDPAQLSGWRLRESVTLVYRVVYLDGLRDRDTVDGRFLGQLAADLAVARGAGVKVVLRFAYTSTSAADAPVERVLAHVDQLVPVVNRASDVVFALQAGFVGRWGEWYYSDHFATHPDRPWDLTPADWDARLRLLTRLVDTVDGGIDLQVRYPQIARRLAAVDPRAARLGVHNDCFLASDTDMGTFVDAGDHAWLAQRSTTAATGGETCAVNAPRSLWPTAALELAAHHYTYLNADFDRDVLGSWGPDGLATATARLGYRIRLTAASTLTSADASGHALVTLTLVNDGYAAPVSSRPAVLVLRSPGLTTSVQLPLDVTTLAPGVSRTVVVDVVAPATPGSYELELALPDQAPTLAARPEYALRLANEGTWDAVHGTNDLQLALRVTG